VLPERLKVLLEQLNKHQAPPKVHQLLSRVPLPLPKMQLLQTQQMLEMFWIPQVQVQHKLFLVPKARLKQLGRQLEKH